MSFEKLFEKLADRPVANVADDVASSTLSGRVTTLSSDTGSGKTLYESARLAKMYGGQVFVLVPRVLVAVNAAETVAELAECELGVDVGYGIGSQGGDVSCFNKDTKLVFVTNGYALASRLVHTAHIFVLDEVHEASMHLSIIRAILHRRIAQGESIKVLEMSATMNVAHQSAYWGAITKTKVFQVDGKTFDCEPRHRPASSVEDEVIKLLLEGRRGILVFRPGLGEVQETARQVERLAKKAKLDIEISQIYGEMDYQEREKAAALPTDGKPKVLVGTNVIESGVNISWFDAGVSCGKGKENGVRVETGATFLELVDLSQWRLKQQEGRVKRFCPGIFVLCAKKSFGERPRETRPEIERLSLTELVMYCAGLGLRTHELTFDYAPDPAKVREAESRLQRLGLIDDVCQLTEAGTAISGLPVGPETGAMLWHATLIGCLGAMLPLAAVIEVGGLRRNPARSHGLDTSSDYLDAVLAFRLMYFAKKRGIKLAAPEGRNISLRRSLVAADLMHDLEQRLNCLANFDFDDLGHDLCQSLLAGSLDKLFRTVGGTKQCMSLKNREQKFLIGQGSVVADSTDLSYVTGDLRVITPADETKSTFTIIEKVTCFGVEDIAEFTKTRPDLMRQVEATQSLVDVSHTPAPSKIAREHSIKAIATPRRESVKIEKFFDDRGAAYRRNQR
jgi:HrpA-like RNA helicase